MDSNTRKILAALSAAAHDAKERVRLLSLINSRINPGDRRAQAIEFDLARAESARATAALDAAIDAYARQDVPFQAPVHGTLSCSHTGSLLHRMLDGQTPRDS